MAYKINIRNQANTAWVNLLEAQYIEVLDANSKFTATDVEAALEELFDNKAQRVTSTSDPGASDDSYQIGTVWVNTSNDTVHICTDDSSGAAVWLNVSSLDSEGIEDIVGAMFTGNTETNITTSYNDTAGTIELSVAAATTTTLGVASFAASQFDVAAGAVSITAGGITVTELANNIDATGIGFNADQVDGTDVNDAGTTTSDLWTASKIKSYVDSTATGLSWQEPVISKDLNDPPASPSTGDRYIVSQGAPPATGAWAGEDNNIAEWNGSSWDFTTTQEGFALWITSEDVQYVYNGTAWAKIGTTITHSNLLSLQGGNGGSELYHLTNAEHSSITGSKTANTVFAAPDGSAGVAGFRALVANDIPQTLDSAWITDFDDQVNNVIDGLISAGTNTNITVTYVNDTSLSWSVATAGTVDGSPGVASFDSSNFTVNGNGHVSINAASLEHGNLTGLGDDDHTQYMHNTSARTVTAQHTFAPASAQAPFVLGANAQGQLVTGLNADLVDGQHWTVAATASAPSSPQTNDVWIELTA